MCWSSSRLTFSATVCGEAQPPMKPLLPRRGPLTRNKLTIKNKPSKITVEGI